MADAEDGSLNSSQAREKELLRSNRELAQVRDQLQQKEKVIQDWKSRHQETSWRLKEVESEVSDLKAKMEKMKTAPSDLAELTSKACSPGAEASSSMPPSPQGSPNESMLAEVNRLKAMLAEERCARAALEAQARSAMVERDGHARQVKRLSEELKQRKAAALAAATAASAHLSRSKEPSGVEDQLEKLQARARILLAENTALRSEASNHRHRIREMQESQAMAAEELWSRRVQAMDAETRACEEEKKVSQVKFLLEETRRARQTEIASMVKKLSKSEDAKTMPAAAQRCVLKEVPSFPGSVNGTRSFTGQVSTTPPMLAAVPSHVPAKMQAPNLDRAIQLARARLGGC